MEGLTNGAGSPYGQDSQDAAFDAVMPEEPDPEVQETTKPPPIFSDFAMKADLAEMHEELRRLRAQLSAADLAGKVGLAEVREELRRLQEAQFKAVDLDGRGEHNTGSESAPPLEEKLVTFPESRTASGSSDKQETVSFSESIWEAAMFAGMPCVGAAGSVLLILGLLANILIQGIFIIIIRENLAKRPFDDEDLSGFSAFRHKIAHDARFVSQANGVSLAERVCNQDLTLEMATTQVETVSEIRAYLGEKGKITEYVNGTLMCQLALAVWIMCILKEVSASMKLLLALWELPGTRRRASQMVGSPLESYELKHLAWTRKVFALLIGGLRLLVAAVLLYIGTQYLCYTTSIGDLLLNAMALEVVINVDELVFHTMAPAAAFQVVTNLAPLPVRSSPRWRGADVPALLTPFIMIGLMVLCFFTSLTDTINNLSDVEQRLCGSRTNFTYEFDGLGMVEVTTLADFNITRAYDTTDIASLAVEEVKEDVPVPQWQYALFSLSTKSTFMDQAREREMTATVRDIYVSRKNIHPNVSDCHNALDRIDGLADQNKILANQWRVWPGYLSAELNLPEQATSCSQIREHCLYNPQQTHLAMAMIRALCPVTCGCNSLLSGSVFVANAMGCPQVCLTAVTQTERETTECEDLDPRSTDPRVNAALAFYAEVELAHPNRSDLHVSPTIFRDFGCQVNQDGLDLCVSSGQTLLAQLTPAAATPLELSKVMTMMCPRTCNCDGNRTGYNHRPPQGACPSSCTCEWTLKPVISATAREDECHVENTFRLLNPSLPQLDNFSIDSQCCDLMKRYFRLLLFLLPVDNNHSRLNKPQRDELGQVHRHLCRPCRSSCLSHLAVLEAYAAAAPLNESTFHTGAFCATG